MRHETTSVRSAPIGGREGRVAPGAALARRLHPPPLPDLAAERPGPQALPGRRLAGLLLPGRARRHPRLRRRGHRLPAPEAQTPQDHTLRLAQRTRRRPACPVAPVAAQPRQAHQPVDAEPGCPGLLREGLDHTPALRRGHPPGPQTPGRRLEARQALAGQPRPTIRAKKKLRDELIEQAARRADWVLGFQDETWWTRLAQPDLHAWAGDEPMRLLPNERGGGKEALACYGLLRAETDAMRLRFVEGRPVSQVTEDFLGWLCGLFAKEGKKVFVLVWDNAAWHVSKRVRRWIGEHNRRVKREGGCKIRVCGLPVKAPWLNPIEPKWLHGKRAIVEPDRKLSAAEVKQRVHQHYGCEAHEPLTQLAA